MLFYTAIVSLYNTYVRINPSRQSFQPIAINVRRTAIVSRARTHSSVIKTKKKLPANSVL